jgi:hypothetical protein
MGYGLAEQLVRSVPQGQPVRVPLTRSANLGPDISLCVRLQQLSIYLHHVATQKPPRTHNTRSLAVRCLTIFIINTV